MVEILTNNPLNSITTLAFDLFGTVLDLSGSIIPEIDIFLKKKKTKISGNNLWMEWRSRQRIEQYQDTILMMGHSGYLTVCKYALIYVLRANKIAFYNSEIEDFMRVYQNLNPFKDAVEGLNKLKGCYKLVGLSNGEPWYLDHLVKNRIKFKFNAVISVEEAGFFKPHPGVYRKASKILNTEPWRIMMVASHSFDLLGARACGYRAAYVNRYDLPTEESIYQPDLIFKDFYQLSDFLLNLNPTRT